MAGAANRHTYALGLLLGLGLVLPPRPAGAAEGPASALERQVKAAYLYKFPGYVEWPAHAFASAEAPFTICVCGDAPLAEAVRRVVVGRTIGGRSIVVRELDRPGPEDGIQVLFVSRSESARLQSIVPAMRARPCLLVTETEGALESGSIINFVLVGGRIRFDISRPAAERAGLGLSSQLLAVARRVVTRTE